MPNSNTVASPPHRYLVKNQVYSRPMKSLYLAFMFLAQAPFCFSQAEAPLAMQRSYLELPYSAFVPFQDEEHALTLTADNSTYYLDLSKLWSAGKNEVPKQNAASAGNGTNAIIAVFDLPAAWSNRQTFVCFPVLKATAQLLVNGRAVETLGSGLPAKLNITSFLQSGGNSIEIRALNGKRIERLTDIADSAYAVSGAIKHVKAIEIEGKADPRIGGMLSYYNPRHGIPRAGYTFLLKSYTPDPWSIDDLKYRIQVYDHLGNKVYGLQHEEGDKKTVHPPGEESHWSLSHPVTGARLWSAESPYRHTVTLTTRDMDTEAVQEVYARKVGFRQVHAREGQFYVNRTLVKLRPVLYELPASDSSLPASYFEELVKALKRHNVNTVIATGNPLPHIRFYELCDRYGLYIIQRLDLKDGSGVDEKARAILHALKNYSSLIAWSVRTVGTGKELPRTITGEIGKVTYYLPVLEESSFSDLRHAPAWNGMPEQQRPALRQAYQRVQFEPVFGANGEGTVKVVNGYDFIPLEKALLAWQVKENGVTVKEGEVNEIAVGAKGSQVLPLPFSLTEFADSTCFTFSFSLKLKEETPWSEASHEIAKEDFVFAADAKGGYAV